MGFEIIWGLAHSYNPSTQEEHEFKVSLGSEVDSRSVWAI